MKINPRIDNFCIHCGKNTYKKNTVCFECKRKFYSKDWMNKKRESMKKEKYKVCILCGSNKDIKPFVGYCPECYKKYQRKYGN